MRAVVTQNDDGDSRSRAAHEYTTSAIREPHCCPSKMDLQTASGVKYSFHCPAIRSGSRRPASQAWISSVSAATMARAVRTENDVPQPSRQNWEKLGIESGPITEHPRTRASLATIGPLSQREVQSRIRLPPSRSATSGCGTTPQYSTNCG